MFMASILSKASHCIIVQWTSSLCFLQTLQAGIATKRCGGGWFLTWLLPRAWQRKENCMGVWTSSWYVTLESWKYLCSWALGDVLTLLWGTGSCLSEVTHCRQPAFPKLLFKSGFQLVILSWMSARIFRSNRFQNKLLTIWWCTSKPDCLLGAALYSPAMAGNVSHQWELHGPMSALSAKSLLISIVLAVVWAPWLGLCLRAEQRHYSLEALGFLPLLSFLSTCGHLLMHTYIWSS